MQQMLSKSVSWILETTVFSDGDTALRDAIVDAGHEFVAWRDTWADEQRRPAFVNKPVVFHGSLGNADLVARTFPWTPGSFCNTSEFRCSSWYPLARRWLLHSQWRVVPLNELVADP